MTIIEKLDALYELSLEMELEQIDRDEVVSLHGAIASKCGELMKNPNFINERKNKFARMRALANDEMNSVRNGVDVLTHYPLLRDYLEDSLAFFKRGCRDFTFA